MDTYRRLDESDSDAAVEDQTEAFMAPFRADFVTATRNFVRRISGPGADQDLVDWMADGMAAAPPQIALDAMKYAVGNERAAIAGLRQAGVPTVAINPAHPYAHRRRVISPARYRGDMPAGRRTLPDAGRPGQLQPGSRQCDPEIRSTVARERAHIGGNSG